MTVSPEMPSRREISALVSPMASRRSISRCRAVRRFTAASADTAAAGAAAPGTGRTAARGSWNRTLPPATSIRMADSSRAGERS
uniref:Uncharacterized protein n=1 Tax=Streptomyces rochei TaxID=1928 RepID=A0A1B1WA73_STRRO|nr:hypothetical protein [Streptomyces rochei]